MINLNYDDLPKATEPAVPLTPGEKKLVYIIANWPRLNYDTKIWIFHTVWRFMARLRRIFW